MVVGKGSLCWCDVCCKSIWCRTVSNRFGRGRVHYQILAPSRWLVRFFTKGCLSSAGTEWYYTWKLRYDVIALA